jgi:hypothetical protein
MYCIFQALGDSHLTSQHPLALGVASPAEAFLILASSNASWQEYALAKRKTVGTLLLRQI